VLKVSWKQEAEKDSHAQGRSLLPDIVLEAGQSLSVCVPSTEVLLPSSFPDILLAQDMPIAKGRLQERCISIVLECFDCLCQYQRVVPLQSKHKFPTRPKPQLPLPQRAMEKLLMINCLSELRLQCRPKYIIFYAAF
jgi:hypothetical protein